MKVIGTKYHDCSFVEYLQLPGYSYSGIRSEGVEYREPSTKMSLGTSVHNYILTPSEYSHEDAKIVRPIAIELQKVIAPMIPFLKPEMAVTSGFEHNGLIMPYKGRIDLGIPSRLVIDIKVSEMEISKGIDYFGYDRQVSGYALSIGAPLALIISIHPKTLKITITNVKISTDWWAHQVIKKGSI